MNKTDYNWLPFVERALHKRINSTERLLVAVSGGADSIGLLFVLMDEIGIGNERIVVGHVNHGIRLDASDDEELVRQLCIRRKLIFSSMQVDAPRLARDRRLSLEAAARELRYKVLAKMADQHDCRWILTGHTMEDSAETVLMRMLSGAPWYEWTGIPSRRGRVLRPLLRIRRDEVRGYVKSRHLDFRDDPTNLDPRYLRNRLRLCLSRKQEFWTRSQISKISEAGQLLWWIMEGYREAARKMLLAASDGSGRFGLEIERILGYFNSLIFVPVEVAWSLLTDQPDARLPSAIRRQIPDFLNGHGPQACLKLPDGIVAHRRGKHVDVYCELNPQAAWRLALGDTVVPEQSAVFSLGLTQPAEADFSAAIDRGFLDHELLLRSWLPGDRIKPSKRPTKRVADLLTERKVNTLERKRALVLADDIGPLWLIGGPVAERALPRSKSLSPLWASWKIHDGT
jgi:tRNA(Ile)-lysidine synthase